MSNLFVPRESSYTRLLDQHCNVLEHDERTLHKITRELLLLGGPLGYVGKKILGFDEKRQERTLRRAQQIGAVSVDGLRQLYDTLVTQRERHRDYLESVKKGFTNASAYTGMSAEDRDSVRECELGLEKILRGDNKDVLDGLQIVLPSLEHVEVLARQEGWYRQAREDYLQYCKEGVLHYAVHLILTRELLLVTDRVGRRVDHQNYLIEHLLDMAKVRNQVMLSSAQLHQLATALHGSERVFGEAGRALRELSVAIADPRILFKNIKQPSQLTHRELGPQG